MSHVTNNIKMPNEIYEKSQYYALSCNALISLMKVPREEKMFPI